MSEQKKAPFEECARLLDQLADTHSLSREEYALLVRSASPELASYAAQKAVPLRKQWYGTDVYLRGLIEISSYCRNDCFYCGIRRGNTSCERYRLTPEQILACCDAVLRSVSAPSCCKAARTRFTQTRSFAS